MTLEIVTANRLADGRTVYLAEAGWSESLEQAQVAGSAPAAKALLALAERAAAHNEVVGPYLIAVVEEAGRLRPQHLRERIRSQGPSVAHGDASKSPSVAHGDASKSPSVARGDAPKRKEAV